MPKRNAEQKAARALQETEGLDYQAALRRVRAEAAAEFATTAAPVSGPAAVEYVLQPTEAEAELGITAEELGVRALSETATPEQRAHAEAVWRPNEPTERCRCSGIKCHHGELCEIEFVDGPCGGRLVHLDRHPGSMFGTTDWYDTHRCDDCLNVYEGTVTVSEIPWGEARERSQLDGTERTLSDGSANGSVLVIYHGIRHPNFPDGILDEDDEDELDPAEYPAPEDDYDPYDGEGQEREEALAEKDQEDGLDRLDDGPGNGVEPIGGPPENGHDEGELGAGAHSRVPAAPARPAADDLEPHAW
ncbi:hypothetical protein ACIQU6_41340 [Streptomyces sp. NPDC090442]|uniref:hypothetical protein n=1 Tax=Streptomyces sp. NPDC090442 TaxID=3365962 RepID=UPI00382858F3